MAAAAVRAFATRRSDQHRNAPSLLATGRPPQASLDQIRGGVGARLGGAIVAIDCADRPVQVRPAAGPPLLIQRCGGTQCPAGTCSHDDDHEVQRQSVGLAAESASAGVLSGVRDVLRAPGGELPAAARRVMESRLGHSFADVRVHTDTAAARSARALDAQAYTVGQDVVFGDGQFAPDTPRGQRLIAHELAHVIQQRTGRKAVATQPLTVSSPSDPAETQADQLADTAMAAPGTESQDAATGRQEQLTSPPDCTTVIGGGVPSGPTVAGFSRASPVLPGSGYPPLLALAEKLKVGSGTDTVQVDGFASEEGDKDFNVRLSCARASRVRDVLRADGVRNSITLVARGATAALGPRHEDNRAVVVTEPTPAATAAADEPAKESEPSAGTTAEAATGPLACVPGAGVTNSVCGAYLANSWWLPLAYVNNATCACERTPNLPKYNCIRKFLQDRLAAVPPSLRTAAAALKPLELSLNSVLMQAYWAWVQLQLTPMIHRDHVDAYAACCCPSGPATYEKWIGVTTVPVPCGLIEKSIMEFGNCEGKTTGW